MHEYLRLGQVSWNSENVHNLAVLHGFITASSFPFLQRLANVPYKYMGLHQRLGQVSWNSMNVQYLVVLHDCFFFGKSKFHYVKMV